MPHLDQSCSPSGLRLSYRVTAVTECTKHCKDYETYALPTELKRR